MYLIYDIGGTFVKYAWMTKHGQIEDKGRFPTRNCEGDTVADFVESLGEIYDKYKEKDIEGIALSLPGLIDVENNIVRNGGGIKYLKNANLGELLKARCDNIPIAMENDGKCAALAEVWMGNAKGCKNAAVVILGTGIGGGIVVDGHVLHGNHLCAGEFSYNFADSFKRSDLDRLADLDSITDMEEEYEKLPFLWSTTYSTRAFCYKVAMAKGLNPKETNGEMIYKWAEEGDPITLELLEDFYFTTAKYLFNVFTAVDPDIILLGGGISAQPAFVEGVKRYVNKLKTISMISSFINVDVCKFGSDSNLLGALYTFRQMYDIN